VWLGVAGIAGGAASLAYSAAGPVLESLRLMSIDGGQAVVLRLAAAAAPTITALRDGRGQVRRVYVDLPPGTRLAASVPRALAGVLPIRGARLGLVEPDRLRLVVDLADGSRYRGRHDPATGETILAVAREGPVAHGPPPAPRLSGAPAEVPSAVAVGRAVVPRRPRVVLDAGHGGDDPGAVGYVVEKHVTLDIVRRLARRLRDDHRIEVILTRSSDATVPLGERTAVANQTRADLFVSVHANANRAGRSKGIETYVLDDAGDHATLRLAAIENGTTGPLARGVATDVGYILSALVQGGKMPDSSRLAHSVQAALVAHLRGRYPGVDDLGVKRGPFYVLVGSHAPCILVEASFVTHPVEGRRLADPAYRAALADGLAVGIRRFLADRRDLTTL
jgi:N-acetylmuramoyl-L-alanine amidase